MPDYEDYPNSCAVFQSERRSMIYDEAQQTLRGFAAAHNGLKDSISDITLRQKEIDAWHNGHGCYTERTFPWVIAKHVYYQKIKSEVEAGETARLAGQKFKDTGELPPEVLQFLTAERLL